MANLSKLQRALISVSKKDGLVDFARGLSAAGLEILSTGGTAKTLAEAGVPVREVSDFTGAPEVLDGHLSTALCHLANVSYRLGASKPSGEAGKALTTAPAQEAGERLIAHLKENGVETDKIDFRIGRTVSIDTKTETCADEEANRLLTREYRKPYVVPENV